MRHHTRTVDGVDVFYREAGPTDAPTLVLLHGFPASSFQYLRLMERLAGRFHLLAPDYPGFGHTRVRRPDYSYTFDSLAATVEAFLDTEGVGPAFYYLFDFGAPVGFRIASRHPDRVRGLVVQNANAYEAGLGPAIDAVRPYWADRAAHEDAMRAFLTLEGTRSQYLGGVRDVAAVAPDGWTLDQHFIDQPGRIDALLDLLQDYGSNVAAYPLWQAWLRRAQPPALVIWGRNDDFFPEAGATAYHDDLPQAEIHLFDTGHFALEEDVDPIAELVASFLDRHTQADNQPGPQAPHDR